MPSLTKRRRGRPSAPDAPRPAEQPRGVQSLARRCLKRSQQPVGGETIGPDGCLVPEPSHAPRPVCLGHDPRRLRLDAVRARATLTPVGFPRWLRKARKLREARKRPRLAAEWEDLTARVAHTPIGPLPQGRRRVPPMGCS